MMRRVFSLIGVALCFSLLLWRPAIAQNDEFFVVATIDNPTPYINEMVFYTLRFYAYDLDRLAPFEPLILPDFNGFWVGDIFEFDNSVEVIDGVQYNVGQIIVELAPLIEDDLRITSSVLRVVDAPLAEGGDFLSNTVDVSVRPFPDDPPDSFGGAIGQFSMGAAVDRLSVDVGEPVRLTVDVQGTGNFPLMPRPVIELGEDWRVITRPPQALEAPDRTLINIPFGRRVFEWLLIPLRAGTLEINDIRFSHFDPTREVYVESDSWNFTINVFPGEAGRDIRAGRQALPQLELLPVSAILTNETAHLARPLWALWLIAPFFALMVGAVTLFRHEQSRRSTYRRTHYALRRALRRLKTIGDYPPQEAAQRIERIICLYVGDKLDAPKPPSPPHIRDRLTGLTTSGTIDDIEDAIIKARSLDYIPKLSAADVAEVVRFAEGSLSALDAAWRISAEDAP